MYKKVLVMLIKIDVVESMRARSIVVATVLYDEDECKRYAEVALRPTLKYIVAF